MANEFSDPTKAVIFARDRATCCFSGANLWLLDAPLRCGWQADWADHIKPRSRGGCADLNNGVCASRTFNAKKRNNTADTAYLFRDGHPTNLYYDLFGNPPKETVERLQRLAHLEPQDWYFNRAIKSILLAFESKWAGADYKRTPEYWFNAAYKKLLAYQKLHAENLGLSSIEARKIVARPGKSQRIFLALRHSESPAAMKRSVMPLYRDYRLNSNAWWNYFSADNEKIRRKAYRETLAGKKLLSPGVWKAIEADFSIRHPNT